MRASSLAGLLSAFVSLPVAALAQTALKGRVVDQDGAALADVAVCLIDEQAAPFLTKQSVRQRLTATGADGRYSVDHPAHLEASRYHLLFVGRGRVHVHVPLTPRDGWPIVLPRAHTLAGRVVDHDGKPVADVRVEARDWLWQARYRADQATIAWLPTPRTAVRTNKRGRFVLPGTMSSAVQLVIGDAFLRSNPVALGDPIELVMPKKGTNLPRDRYRSDSRVSATGDANAKLQKIAGTTELTQLPPFGASLHFFSLAKDKDERRRIRDARSNYQGSVPIADDGTFSVALEAGSYRPRIVLPRAFRQGQPDFVDLKPVAIVAGQQALALDLREHMPLQVAGTVRGSVPPGRLVVGGAVRFTIRGTRYGYAHYECALAPVAPDGSFAMQVPPGECTFFVLDLWSGMMLHRDPRRTLATGDAPELAFQIDAGACDIKLVGEVSKLSWLELNVPDEWVPNGIDRITRFMHQYTKRIGCMVPPGTSSLRLYLPPIATELWLVASDQGDLTLPRGQASIDVMANKTTSATIEVPN